jgi:hypothetical protein
MSNVIQSNFKQVRRDYGHKKISQKGVEKLQELQKFLLRQSSITPNDLFMTTSMITEILDEEINDKYFMNSGNQEV